MGRKGRKRKLTDAISRKIVLVNASDADYTSDRFILWFGAYGDTVLMVWADHLEDALDEAVDWIADNAPGLLADDEVADEYKRLVAEGKDEDEARDEAEVDTTIAGNNGHYLHSWEWGIVAENPSRADVLSAQGRPAEHRARGADLLAKKMRRSFGKRRG